MDDKYSVENKACNKHSLLIRWGLLHQTSQALLHQRSKLNASGFEAVASLVREATDDALFREGRVMDNILGKGTQDRLAYRNFHGS